MLELETGIKGVSFLVFSGFTIRQIVATPSSPAAGGQSRELPSDGVQTMGPDGPWMKKASLWYHVRGEGQEDPFGCSCTCGLESSERSSSQRGL